MEKFLSTRYPLIGLGVILVWASVAVIAYGTHRRNLSPRFAEYQQQVIDRATAANPGRDLGRGFGIGAAVASTWPFVAMFCGFIAVTFTLGARFILGIGRWHRDIGLLIAGAFGFGCAMGALLGASSAIHDFRWGFAVRAAGFLISALGLAIGSVGIARAVSRIAPVRSRDRVPTSDD